MRFKLRQIFRASCPPSGACSLRQRHAGETCTFAPVTGRMADSIIPHGLNRHDGERNEVIKMERLWIHRNLAEVTEFSVERKDRHAVYVLNDRGRGPAGGGLFGTPWALRRPPTPLHIQR